MSLRQMIVAVCLVLASGLALGQAAAAGQRLDEASRAYEEQRYAESADAWQQLLDEGFWHESVLYNLGCARARQGELGPAVLAFRRALYFDPRLDDAESNLQWVRAQLADAADGAPGTSSLARASAIVPLRAGLLAALALEWIAILLIGWSLLAAGAPRWARAAGITLLVAALLLGGAPLTRLALRASESGGVVLAPRVEARSGPGDSHPVLFTLHEGHEVTLGSTRTGWVRLTTGDGLAGWIPQDSVASVAPGQPGLAESDLPQGD